MVPTTHAKTWTAYYAQNRSDEGAIQALFEETMGTLTETSVTHLGNPGKLIQTIAGTGFGNMMIVPGPPGTINLLHHGFSCKVPTGFALVFVQGNLSDCSVFKILPMDEATKPVEATTTGRPSTRQGGATLDCPTLERMFEARTAEDFKKIPANGNDVLMGKPNHLLVLPEVFFMTKGAKTFQAKDLAIKVLERLRPIDGEEEAVAVARRKEAEMLEAFLAFLWASENKNLVPITLEDLPDESPTLNQMVRNVKGKLGSEVPQEVTVAGLGPTGAETLALTSQSMIMAINKLQETRDDDKSKREEESSLFKTMGPTQQKLVTDLCTADMSATPVISEFMSSLSTTKSPHKAIGLLLGETLEWEGTFCPGSFHKFLAGGFRSMENNGANPGGFTLFMFHPKTVEMGGKFDESTSNLRDYFGMKVEASTIAYYAKRGYFAPTNVYDLRIQLQTALDMLELLTGKGSIATTGLSYLLGTTKWRKFARTVHERFKTEPGFGTKLIYTLDRSLQNFFEKVSEWEDMAKEGTPGYLVSNINDLLDMLAVGRSLSVTLPAVLMTKDRPRIPQDVGEGAKVGAIQKRKVAGNDVGPAASPKPSAPHVNMEPCPAWLANDGEDYLDLFPDREPGAKPWPRFVDPRLPKRNRKVKKVPLCAKFQMTKSCRQGCPMAHIYAVDMDVVDRAKCDDIFREAIRSRP